MAEPTRLSEAELGAYFALRGAGDRLQRAVTAQLRSFQLTEVQFSVLATLGASSSPMGMSELAEALVVTKSGLSYQATQLEQRQLVLRSTAAHDDRAVQVQLTARGRELLASVLPAHIALVRELFLDRIEADELTVVTRALGRVASPADGAP